MTRKPTTIPPLPTPALPDLAGSLRALADHIDQHDLPTPTRLSLRLTDSGYLSLQADSQRAVADWASSLNASVVRTPVAAHGTGYPFVLYSCAAEDTFGVALFGVAHTDRQEGELLASCPCNDRNICEQCATLNMVVG